MAVSLEIRTIRDDLALKLYPSDISAGRIQIREAIAGCERWFDNRTNWLNLIRWGAIASFTLSSADIMANQFRWPLIWPLAASAAFSMCVCSLCIAAPVLVQNSFIDWNSRFPLNDRLLAPLKAYLSEAAANPIPLHDHEGNPVTPEFLKNPWAVLLFSEREEIRRMPTYGEQGILRVRYSKWLTVERSSKLAVAQSVVSDTPQPVTILIDLSVTNIDRRTQQLTVDQRTKNVYITNHFAFFTHVISQVDKVVVSNRPDGEPTKSEATGLEQRWPCEFDEIDFFIRLKLLGESELCKARSSIRPYQIKKYVIAVLAARRIWDVDRKTKIADLAKTIGKLVKSNTDGWAGLNQSDSTDWIKAVIGGTGNYAFVKETFNSISYDPSKHDGAQYHLLLQ
jgi:hypothetical protein